jgi:hypothetical protein
MKDTWNGSAWRLQAKILGRVERLLGSDSSLNPFPAMSPQWEAFREGWLRALDDPISREIRIGRRPLTEKVREASRKAFMSTD